MYYLNLVKNDVAMQYIVFISPPLIYFLLFFIVLGFDELVLEGKTDDLARFYVLFSRVYALDLMQTRFAAYIVVNRHFTNF